MINQKEFTKWRKTGQAFEVRETLYDRPNRVTATVEGMKEVNTFFFYKKKKSIYIYIKMIIKNYFYLYHLLKY